MQSITRTYYVSLLLLFLLVGSASAIGPLKVGFSGGISMPNEAVANVLNSENEVDWASVQTGYNLGLNLRFDFPLTDWGLQFGVAYHNFPLSKGSLEVGGKPAEIEINRSIIPFTAGINYKLFSMAEIIDFYTGTAISYNYTIYTVEFPKVSVPIPLSVGDGENNSEGRFGLNFSTGINVNAVIFTGNIEAKYSLLNLIGSEDDEELKSYFALSLGIYF